MEKRKYAKRGFIFSARENRRKLHTDYSNDVGDNDSWATPCTLGRMPMKLTRRVLGHSLLRSLVRSHRSFIHLLTSLVRSAAVIRSLSRSLTLFQSSWQIDFRLWNERVDFPQFLLIVQSLSLHNDSELLEIIV